MKLEAKPFLTAVESSTLKKSASYRVYYGEIAGAKVLVAICGVGMDRAAAVVESLLGSYDISRVIMSGTACGIDSKLDIGDTVVSEEILFYNKNESLLLSDVQEASGTAFRADKFLLDTVRTAIEKNPPDHPVYYGRIATGKSFVTSKTRDIIARSINPLCADMETAATARVCHMKGVPFIAVRSISDNADKSGFAAFLRYASLASKHSYIVVRRLLRELRKAEK